MLKQLLALTIGFFVMTNILVGQVNVTLSMDTLDIPATNIPTSIATTGRNVSVISAEEIRSLPVTSIDGVLRYLPGVEVQMRNGFGAQGDISMRGSTFTQVLILIDGMRLNDPLTAHFNSNIPVAISEIERIEVLRGPAAAMYGPDAVGGVIHIVTKTFAASTDKSTQTDASLEFDYGQNNLYRGNLGFLHKRNGVKIGVSGLINQSDGQTIGSQTFINGDDTTSLDSYNNYFDVRTATLSFSVPVNDEWQLSLRSAFDYRDFSARYFYTSNVFDKSTEITSNMWLQGQARHIGEKSSTEINLAYKYNEDEFVFSPDFSSTNNHSTQFANLQVHHLLNISEKLDIKAGLQTDYRSVESNDRGNHEDIHAGIYGIAIVRPMDKMQLTGSLRMDYDENYGIEVLPQLNGSFHLHDKFHLRAAFGRTTRAADYTERYVANNRSNLMPGRNLGNPNLKAETSWSSEIGFDFFPIPEWRITSTLFARQGNNLIDYVLTNEADILNNDSLQSGGDYLYATNIAEVQTNGFEIESWYFRQMTRDFSINWGIGYTVMETTNEDGIISAYLSNHARQLVTTNFILNYKKIDLSINGLYKKRAGVLAPTINATLSDRYSVWNLKLGFQLANQLNVHLLVHNLFNEQYADILGAKMPDRWLMGGIRWNL